MVAIPGNENLHARFKMDTIWYFLLAFIAYKIIWPVSHLLLANSTHVATIPPGSRYDAHIVNNPKPGPY